MDEHTPPQQDQEQIEFIELGNLDHVVDEFPPEESLLLRGSNRSGPGESHRVEDEFPSESSPIEERESEVPARQVRFEAASAPVAIGAAHRRRPALAAVAALAVVAITGALALGFFVRSRPQDQRPSATGTADVVLTAEATAGPLGTPVEGLAPTVDTQSSSIAGPIDIREMSTATPPPPQLPPRVVELSRPTGGTAVAEAPTLASKEVLASNTNSETIDIPPRPAADLSVVSPVGTAGAAIATEPRPAVERPADPNIAATARAPLAPVVTPAGEVQRALSRYQNAFSQLDVAAVRQVWPTVNGKAVAKAFDQLRQENLVFESCAISVSGQTAVAACVGTTRYVPKVGNKSARVERQQWLFSLRQVTDAWVIDTVEVGPG